MVSRHHLFFYRQPEEASSMNALPRNRKLSARGIAMLAAMISGVALAGCTTTPTGELTTIEVAQGSDENISSLTAVIERNPSDPEAYNVRGSAYGRGGKYQEALRDFDKALQLRPNFYQAYANRALIHRFLGDQASALADYNRSIQLNPSYDAAYIGRGNLYRKAGRVQEAFSDFQRAIQLDTTDPRAYHNRGLIYQSQGQHAFAIEDFSTAISLAPDAAEPYNGRGLSYIATNDEENAFADFNMAIKLDGKIAESWANQALIYERRGDKQRAAKSYARAAQLDPNYKPAVEGLARTRAGCSRPAARRNHVCLRQLLAVRDTQETSGETIVHCRRGSSRAFGFRLLRTRAAGRRGTRAAGLPGGRRNRLHHRLDQGREMHLHAG